MIQKFIKKPNPIEAVECVPENEADIRELLERCDTEWEPILDDDYAIIGYRIHSWEGAEPVYYDVDKNENGKGKPYWIIRGLRGEAYPCVADAGFQAPLGYEEVVPNDAPAVEIDR